MTPEELRRGAAVSVRDALASQDGARIYGGCESCDAYQEIENMGNGTTMIHVLHDEWCPEQKKREGR